VLEARQCTDPGQFGWLFVVVLTQADDLRPGLCGEADNAPSAREKEDGWLILFDGKSLNGRQTNTGQPSKVPIEDGCINPHGSEADLERRCLP
jgi:hypothetical protein